MLEFINEPVTVEVRVPPDGTVRPLAFVWRGRRLQIESWGRESTETRDGRTLHCYLIQTPGPETWELCQDTETAQWLLARHWAERYRAV
jgi:hypothetical protein